jgi:hypothetical protein
VIQTVIDVPGNYTIKLKVRSLDPLDVVASASINVIVLDPNITEPPGVFFGTGNGNGNFKTSRKNGIELALRGELH